MVAAGLTGTTPHMISATINAISRLIFEFKGRHLPKTSNLPANGSPDELSENLISELVLTTSVFVSSKNREIVKSALGFVKVAIVALPLPTISPHLHILVPALLEWVHDHKNHFKQKTVHIFERMIRKLGYQEIIRYAGEGEGGERKVLEGIKRKKERAKKKKANSRKDEEKPVSLHCSSNRTELMGVEQMSKASSGNAFDDILYNSDSDLSSDGEDEEAGTTRRVRPLEKKGRRDVSAYIRNEGERPMDLLSRSIAGGVSSQSS